MHVPGEDWGQAKVFTFMDKLGIDYGDGYDTDLHEAYFKGMEFDIVLDSEEDVMRKPKQPGQKEGDPILDGEGNQITNGWIIRGDIANVPDKCRPNKVELGF